LLSECPSEIASCHDNDDSMSVVSESANDASVKEPEKTPKKLGRPPKNAAAAKAKKGRKRKHAEKEEEEHEESDTEAAGAADDSAAANSEMDEGSIL
jgi:hypothetical protein